MSNPDPRIAFFDHHAATWDTSGPPIGRTLARLDALWPLLGLRGGQEVLEVGCGTGQVTNWLADHVRPGGVTCVDFSPAMVAQARARGAAREVWCRDVCTCELGAARFDVVWCMHVFPHFADQAAALRNLARAMKSAGELVVLHLDSWRNINAFHTNVGGPVRHDHLPEPQAWPALLATAGLQPVSRTERDDLFLLRAGHANPAT